MGMYKNLSVLVFGLLSFQFAFSQGDTTMVKVLNYNSSTRDTIAAFPNSSTATYEKIIMLYNMRCTDGLVSPPVAGQTNVGCGEWDYSCNTYLHDSSRVDSTLSTVNSHTITSFTGTTYDYVSSPTYTYYQFTQKEVQASIVSETNHLVGTGTTALGHVLATGEQSSKSHYLFTATELQGAGLSAGSIDALSLNVLASGSANFLRIGLKATLKTALDPSDVDAGFTQVYFNNENLSAGTHRFQFYAPFTWDGTSNVIVEFSNTNTVASSAATIEGGSVNTDHGMYTENGYHLLANNAQDIQLPTAAMSTITDEVTVSFWTYGDDDVLPRNTYIFEGKDASNLRQVNVHLPWNNSQVYWDSGNDGSGYDRINQPATSAEFSGSWTHWAFTKNATTGVMQIIRNGSVWLSGTGKIKTMDIQDFEFLQTYYGKANELRIWDKALSAATVQNWMNIPLDNTHPDYANLVAYYPLDHGTGSTVTDLSPANASATVAGLTRWGFERGKDLNRAFQTTDERPNLTFYTGTYTLSVVDTTVLDSVVNTPNQVTVNQIVPKWGTMEDDSIASVSVTNYWEAVGQPIYNESGALVGTIPVTSTGSITLSTLNYFRRFPTKFEILSFVTPYGINLDLGMEGKTYAFDVTDFAPILKGNKRFTMERGGQWQEEMNIQFMFITGTPPRDVIDIQQLWRVDSKGYTSIINDASFEPRDVPTDANGKAFKLRSVITGHGQEGEFIPRQHYLDVNGGSDEFVWQVYTECSENPVFPQGGTWIFDRAGWCPGFPSDVAEYDITSMVTAGQTVNIDYGMYTATGNSNYIVNNQMVTYGAINHSVDAAMDVIIAPSRNVFFARSNPICDNAIVRIKNTGSTALTSVEIVYGVEGRQPQTYTWNGNLSFGTTVDVTLPMNHEVNWNGSSETFIAKVQNPNNTTDEYSYNDELRSAYDVPNTYPGKMVLWFQTNNAASENYYEVRNAISGQVLYSRNGMSNGTLYRDTLDLAMGCYTFEVFDTDDDGMDFFANNDGVGSIRFREVDGPFLESFEADFGGGLKHNFTIGYTVDVPEIESITEFKVFPNPSNGIFQFEMNGFQNKDLTLEVFNTMGQKVHQETFVNTGKFMAEALNLSFLASGVYIVKLNDGSTADQLRITKQ